MTSGARGESDAPNRPRRTIISHRDFEDAADEFPDDQADEAGGFSDDSSLKPTNGTTDATANGNLSYTIIKGADQAFERAASATPAGKTTTHLPDKSTTNPNSTKSTKSKALASATTNKPSTAADKPKTTWAGASGPDNSITINGEQQWEIASIVGQEGADVLLVKWKGWKGVWEEDRDVIAESAPELVKEWEAKVEKLGKEKASTKGRGRGRPKGSGVAKAEGEKKGKGAGKPAMTAGKAATKPAIGRGRPKKITSSTTTKKSPTTVTATPAATPAKRAPNGRSTTATTTALAAASAPSTPAKTKPSNSTTKKSTATKPTKSPKKIVGLTKSPKKATATKAARKTIASPKKKGGGAGKARVMVPKRKGRGRPARK